MLAPFWNIETLPAGILLQIIEMYRNPKSLEIDAGFRKTVSYCFQISVTIEICYTVY